MNNKDHASKPIKTRDGAPEPSYHLPVPPPPPKPKK
jgi:hypothetical protein